MFCKKGVLKNFIKFIGKHLCQSVQLQGCNFIKKELLAQVLSRESYEFYKNTFFIEYPRWVLLKEVFYKYSVIPKFSIWRKLHIFDFRGYLAYKTITSHNCHLRRWLRIFLFRRKVIFQVFQDIQIFVFLTIPWFSKNMTSWWVKVHETGCIVEYVFWTSTH